MTETGELVLRKVILFFSSLMWCPVKTAKKQPVRL